LEVLLDGADAHAVVVREPTNLDSKGNVSKQQSENEMHREDLISKVSEVLLKNAVAYPILYEDRRIWAALNKRGFEKYGGKY
jgi:hypothetical protein